MAQASFYNGSISKRRKIWCHFVFVRFFAPSIHEQRSSRRNQHWQKLGNMCQAAPNPKSLTVILLQEICQMWTQSPTKKQQAVTKPWWRYCRVKAPTVCLPLEGQQMLSVMTQSADRLGVRNHSTTLNRFKRRLGSGDKDQPLLFFYLKLVFCHLNINSAPENLYQK